MAGAPIGWERQSIPSRSRCRDSVVAVTGSTQPAKLAELFRDADAGSWPGSVVLAGTICSFPAQPRGPFSDMTW